MSFAQINNIEPEYIEYLRDESRKTGTADTISFPKTEDEVRDILRQMYQKKVPVTVQGSRTGITAGAVPFGGHVLNLTKMNKITALRFDETQDCFFLTVQPGVLLTDLRKSLEDVQFDVEDWSDDSKNALEKMKEMGKWFFTPDPTETSASIGGMVACNASGARSFFYGPTRKYIEAINVVLPDGDMLRLRRGEQKVQGRQVSITTEQGRIIECSLPDYTMPDVKNAAGYYATDGMDILDLFIGSEGTLGIVTEIEIRLLKMPEVMWGIMAFFPDEDSALNFVRGVRGEQGVVPDVEITGKPVAIEFFNHSSLDLLREQKKTGPAFSEIPDMPEDFHTAVYVEYHGDSEDAVGEMVMETSELLEACGGNEDATWLAASPREMERLLFFRHAVPEAVNLLIDKRRSKNPSLTKLGTDMAVPDDKLIHIMSMYNKDLDEHKLESVMFGHIGDNHIHVNILPNSMEEYDQGKSLYLEWAKEVLRVGGTVSAEHGVGKLKTNMLAEMYGQEGIAGMLRVKNAFDPDGLLNAGNLFDENAG